jgi:hypothetical protein
MVSSNISSLSLRSLTRILKRYGPEIADGFMKPRVTINNSEIRNLTEKQVKNLHSAQGGLYEAVKKATKSHDSNQLGNISWGLFQLANAFDNERVRRSREEVRSALLAMIPKLNKKLCCIRNYGSFSVYKLTNVKDKAGVSFKVELSRDANPLSLDILPEPSSGLNSYKIAFDPDLDNPHTELLQLIENNKNILAPWKEPAKETGDVCSQI